MLVLANYYFKTTFNYRTYRLTGTSPKCDRTVSKENAKMENRVTPHMKSHAFDAFDLISIFESLKKFKIACDTTAIRENAAMWLLHFYMNKSSSAVLNEPLVQTPPIRSHHEGRLLSRSTSSHTHK